MQTVENNKIPPLKSERVIMGTKIIVIIKRMQFRDKDQTRKTDIHDKEHKVTKIIRTK